MSWFDLNACGPESGDPNNPNRCREVFGSLQYYIETECAPILQSRGGDRQIRYDACLDDPQTRARIARNYMYPAFERHMRRLNFMALTGGAARWEDYKITWDKRLCLGGTRCERIFDRVKKLQGRQCAEDSKKSCQIDIEEQKQAKGECDAGKSKSDELCKEIKSQPDIEQKSCQEEFLRQCLLNPSINVPKQMFDDYVYFLRILDGYTQAEAAEDFSLKFFNPPQWVVDAKGSARDLTKLPRRVAVARTPEFARRKNIVGVHLGLGPISMWGGLGSLPVGCRDGTTSCWRGTGPLPPNGAGNPSELKPAGALFQVGVDYFRLLAGPMAAFAELNGSFLYLPTDSTGGPNDDPAAIMVLGIGARAGLALYLGRRVRLRAGGGVDLNYLSLSGGNGTLSVPYKSDVTSEQFSQWSPAAGPVLGVDFRVIDGFYLGVEGMCSFPLADLSREVPRFDEGYINPDVTGDRPSPTAFCGAAVRGALGIYSF